MIKYINSMLEWWNTLQILEDYFMIWGNTFKIIKTNFVKVYLLIFREIGTVWVGEGQKKGERENPKQALCCHHRVRHGAQTHETMRSWPELKPRVWRLTNRATWVPLKIILIEKDTAVKASGDPSAQNFKYSLMHAGDQL